MEFSIPSFWSGPDEVGSVLDAPLMKFEAVVMRKPLHECIKSASNIISTIYFLHSMNDDNSKRFEAALVRFQVKTDAEVWRSESVCENTSWLCECEENNSQIVLFLCCLLVATIWQKKAAWFERSHLKDLKTNAKQLHKYLK